VEVPAAVVSKKGEEEGFGVGAVTALVIALDLQMQLGAKSRRAAGHHTILDLNDVGGCVVAQVTLGITLHDIVDLLEFVGKPLLAAELVLVQGEDQLFVVLDGVRVQLVEGAVQVKLVGVQS